MTGYKCIELGLAASLLYRGYLEIGLILSAIELYGPNSTESL
jgi:hypothetical protein